MGPVDKGPSQCMRHTPTPPALAPSSLLLMLSPPPRCTSPGSRAKSLQVYCPYRSASRVQRKVANKDLEGQTKDSNDKRFVEMQFKIEVCVWKVLGSD